MRPDKERSRILKPARAVLYRKGRHAALGIAGMRHSQTQTWGCGVDKNRRSFAERLADQIQFPLAGELVVVGVGRWAGKVEVVSPVYGACLGRLDAKAVQVVRLDAQPRPAGLSRSALFPSRHKDVTHIFQETDVFDGRSEPRPLLVEADNAAYALMKRHTRA